MCFVSLFALQVCIFFDKTTTALSCAAACELHILRDPYVTIHMYLSNEYAIKA